MNKIGGEELSNKGRTIFRKWLNNFIEYITFLPVILFVAIYFTNKPLILIGCLPIITFLAIVFRIFVQAKIRVIYFGFTSIVSVSFVAFFYEGQLSSLIVFAMCWIVTFRAIIYAERDLEDEMTLSSLWVGFSVYFISYFFYRYIEVLNSYLGLITWTCIFMVVTALFISNSHSLYSSTLSKQKKPFVSKVIKAKNRAFIIAMLSLIAIITNLKIVQILFLKMIEVTRQVLVWLLSITKNDPPDEEAIVPLPQTEALPVFVGDGTSQLALIAEKILIFVFYVGFILITITLLVFIAIKLGPWLTTGFHWFKKFLTKIFNLKHRDDEQDYQYVDEKESLFNFEQWRQNKKEQANKWLKDVLFRRKPKWEDLSNPQKVRYVYRQLVTEQVKQGFVFKASHTPSQIIEAMTNQQHPYLTGLLDAYGKARYGRQHLTNEEIAEVSKVLKSLERKEL